MDLKLNNINMPIVDYESMILHSSASAYSVEGALRRVSTSLEAHSHKSVQFSHQRQ